MNNFKSRKEVCWPLFIVLAATCVLFPLKTFGQSSNRWLLIFEITSSMRHRTNGVLNETQDLLRTGMHGQMHRGDTIGIWTFNDKLHAGEAPLQVWSPDAAPTITRRTLQFLSQQQYARSARMEEMLTNMLNIINSSAFITVILFTDADDPIKGTAFDAPINEFYKANYHQLKRAAMPAVTVLRGVRGEITTNTMNVAPWPVDIPFVPLPPQSPPPKPPIATPKPAPPAVPPLIFIGKKPEATATPPPESNVVPQALPSNTPVAPPGQEESNTVVPKAESPEPPTANLPPGTPVATSTAPAVESAGSKPSDSGEAPAAQEQSSISVAANQSSSQVAAQAASPAAATKRIGTSDSNAPSGSPPVGTAATTTPPENLLSARNIAIASVAFAVIVCGLLIMSARRARASQSSLITRSLDRERR